VAAVFSYSRKLTSLPYYGALYGGSFQPHPPPAEEDAALARPILRVDSAPAEVGALQSLTFRLHRSLEKHRPLMQALQSLKFRLIRPYQGP
jgi:hypothetical protein